MRPDSALEGRHDLRPIPAYNEADRIAATLAAVQSFAAETHIQEIIVVDDGSTDDTADRARPAGADVVFRQQNSGKGAALNRGLALAQGDILLLLDADLGASATEAVRLLGPVVSGAADMSIATFPRKPGTGGGVGLVVRLAALGNSSSDRADHAGAALRAARRTTPGAGGCGRLRGGLGRRSGAHRTALQTAIGFWRSPHRCPIG